MMDIGETWVYAQDRKRLIAEADRNMTILENEILRLHGIIAAQKTSIDNFQRRATIDACSLAGYRAYEKYVRDHCEPNEVDAAIAAYVAANDARAVELGAPHLRKTKR